MKALGRKVCALLFFLIADFGLFGMDGGYSWDFSDCDIRDILYVISVDSGISIVADDTVKGKGSFRFSGNDFGVAFDSFLNAERLYVFKDENLWTVSRFRVVENDGLYCLDACDLSAEQIIEKLSVKLKSVITYDALPSGVMNMHFKDLSELELLESVCLRLNGCQLEKRDSGYHFAKKNGGSGAGNYFAGSGAGNDGKIGVFRNEDGSFLVDVKDADVYGVLEEIFVCERNALTGNAGEIGEACEIGEAGWRKDFCFLVNNNSKVLRSCFYGRDFDETLNLFCAQNGLGVIVSDGIYYVVSDSMSKEKIISEEKVWKKVCLEYTKAEKIVSILNRRFGKFDYVVLPDEMSFLVCLSEKDFCEMEALLLDIDVKTQTYLVELKFIKPEQLLKYLPPDVDKSCLFVADDNSCVYFKGTDPAYLNLCKQLEMCDRPVVRVSYDLLILQYEDGNENLWSSGVGAGRMSKGDRNNVVLTLGNVMNLNLNVVSAFGLNFAAQLQCSLEENKTEVFADTILHGVSGKQINFQNTNTYRYRDNNLDPETGKPVYSGVTKEIVSGLKLDVTGFVSGDGMITSTVKASVSRQGNDTSASTGNPPATSEKVVTTEVCGKSGEPIIISGLVQNSSMYGSDGIPFLSKIPVIGKLFVKREKIKEKSEMVIYLVPHIDEYGNDFVVNDEDSLVWGKKMISDLCGLAGLSDGCVTDVGMEVCNECL